MEKSQIIHLQTKTEQATTPRHKQAKITSKSQLFITKQVGSLAVQSSIPAITYFPHIGSHWPMHEFLKQTYDLGNKMILFTYYIHIFMIYILIIYIFDCLYNFQRTFFGSFIPHILYYIVLL